MKRKDTRPTTAGSSAKASDSQDVAEQKRLNDVREAGIPWKKWGPYLSERQWGTVREDYSDDGNAWDYFSHDRASRSHRRGAHRLPGAALLSPLSKSRLERILGYLLDENEFLSPHGIRSLSRYHKDHPFVFHVGGHAHAVSYLPAESDSGMFGGNSNWRGPVWMPVNALIVRGLLNLYAFYGDDFTVECPTGSGKRMTLLEVAHEISRRLASIFLRDATGRRPVYGGTTKFQDDPHWRDLILFYEYFHGDNGAGLGASHQTGWTGVIAMLLDLFGRMKSEDILEAEKGRLADEIAQQQARGR
jgi:hypothetical protein